VTSIGELICRVRIDCWAKKLAPSYFSEGHAGPGCRTENRSAGAAVMVAPWNKCPTLLFVDGLSCLAMETNDHRLKPLHLNLVVPRTFIPGDVISCYTWLVPSGASIAT
jgi:hypothetical protein